MLGFASAHHVAPIDPHGPSMTPLLPALALLGAVGLPDHVAGPGPLRLAVSGGVENLRPAATVHLGVFDWLALYVDGVWHDEAPLLGAELRLAAGRDQRGLWFAHAFFEGHLRPVFDADVISGADVGGGIGVVLRWHDVVARVDGGLTLGFEGPAAGIDERYVDQRGGLFGLQRALLGYDLFEHLELALTSRLGIPVTPVRVESPTDDEFADRWDVRWGARATVRF